MKFYFLTFALVTLISFNSCITSLHRLATYDTVVKDSRIHGQWKTKDLLVNVEDVLNSPLVKGGVSGSFMESSKPAFSDLDKKDSLLFSQSYIISYDKNLMRYHMLASLIRLHDQLLVDIMPIDFDSVSSSFSFHGFKQSGGGAEWLQTHSFAKVNFISNKRLELKFYGGDFFYDQLKKGHIGIKHESDELFDSDLITASTSDLQKFIVKYGCDERFFDKDNTIILDKQ